jgi:hypothetical protein
MINIEYETKMRQLNEEALSKMKSVTLEHQRMLENSHKIY